MFNESVLGPIWKHSKKKRPSSPVKPSHRTLPDSTGQQREGDGAKDGHEKGNKMSAFERMMRTFDAYKEIAVVAGQPDRAEKDGRNGRDCGVTVFGGGWESFGAAQNKRWQDFVSGSTKDTTTTDTSPVGSHLWYIQCRRY